ncbi:unnamed protein product, partial [Amoebophrya sp. A120]
RRVASCDEDRFLSTTTRTVSSPRGDLKEQGLGRVSYGQKARRSIDATPKDYENHSTSGSSSADRSAPLRILFGRCPIAMYRTFLYCRTPGCFIQVTRSRSSTERYGALHQYE